MTGDFISADEAKAIGLILPHGLRGRLAAHREDAARSDPAAAVVLLDGHVSLTHERRDHGRLGATDVEEPTCDLVIVEAALRVSRPPCMLPRRDCAPSSSSEKR